LICPTRPPPLMQEFPCTDDGNGDRLVAQYRDLDPVLQDVRRMVPLVRLTGGSATRPAMLALAKRVARTESISRRRRPQTTGREKVGKWALRSGMLSRMRAMIACAARPSR